MKTELTTDNRDHLGLLMDSCLTSTVRFVLCGDPARPVVSYAELHFSMANALRSARVMDREIARQLGGDLDWWQHVEEGSLVQGVRFARNVVEHERAELVDVARPRHRGIDREAIWDVAWANYRPDRPGRPGEAEYRERFAGQPIPSVLAALNQPLLDGGMKVLGFV